MVRPKKMDNGKITTVMLEQIDLDYIEKARGKESTSGYIRSLIQDQREPKGAGGMITLKKELRDAKLKIAAFERNQRIITLEKEATLTKLGDGFILYHKSHQDNLDTGARQRWIDARCKNTGVTPVEFLHYAKEVGLIND